MRVCPVKVEIIWVHFQFAPAAYRGEAGAFNIFQEHMDIKLGQESDGKNWWNW